ncbi:MAG: YfhO family protein, partial [Gemmatimonadales bacterium]
LPMLAGKFLAGPWSDQYSAGYAFRTWGAEQLRRTGHVALWNPEMFGGLPFVAALHGDIFYPTSWLRIFFSMPTVMDFGFVLHYFAAALFTYLLLRRLSVPWLGAVVGGLAYQLSGLIASYPLPGHDGKLFVSTMLPLAMLALVMGIRERRWSGHALLAVAVGLALLSPHFQMTYYMLIAAGLFALYLAFGEDDGRSWGERIGLLGLALVAVLVGFGISAIQVLPFYGYLPFSPRAQGYHGFEGATSYAIPWAHFPEFFLKWFTGLRETYWGPNGLKLHSEYLGLPVVALAILGAATRQRRRLVLWLGGIGLLFLLIGLGAGTPFYQVWWTLMPYVKQTRAPGMAFFVVALVVAVLAALGVERLERREGAKHVTGWLVAAAVVAVLALVGAFGAMALSYASAHEATLGIPLARAAEAGQSAIRWGALSSALALALVGVFALAWLRGKLKVREFGVLLVLVVGTDLWLNANRFWVYSDAHQPLFQADPITDRIKASPLPYRVLDRGVYPTLGSALMAFDLPEVLGHHGFELNRYDQLLGGQGEWPYIQGISPIWDLLAVRYVIAPAQEKPLGEGVPEFTLRFRRVLAGVSASSGQLADLYERNDSAPAPYARVVPAAVKVPDEQTVPTLLNPRLDYSRLVLLPEDAPVQVPRLDSMPAPSASRATFLAWEPGLMTVRLDPAPENDSYLVVSENWYPDWRAEVDGSPARVLRGDQSLLTVPLPRGVRVVQLRFESASYRTGKGITLSSLAIVLLALLLPSALKRRRG